MSVFNINFRKLASDLMPHFLREPQHVKIYEHPLSAIQEVNNNLLVVRDQIAFDLSFTGQKIYLQELLNLIFDPIGRAIYIENQTDFLNDNFEYFDIEGQSPEYEYFEAEGNPPSYDYLQSEYGLAATFIVFVPNSLVFDLNEMNALINKYRAAGRPHAIQLF